MLRLGRERRHATLGERAVTTVVLNVPVADVLVLVAASRHDRVVLVLRDAQPVQERPAVVRVKRQLVREVAVLMRRGELRAVGPAAAASVLENVHLDRHLGLPGGAPAARTVPDAGTKTHKPVQQKLPPFG